jgi:predicted permease
MLPTILKYKLRQIHNTLARGSRQKKLGWVISIGFIVPYYVTLMRFIRHTYAEAYGNFQWKGLAQIVSANLAVVFFFVLVSTAALTLYRMFQAKDLPLLMSLPARDRSLFLAKSVESLADAGRSMILPSPICLAFIFVLISRVRSPFSALIFLIGWVIVMIQLVGISVIFALILGRAFTAGRWAVIVRIALPFAAALAFLIIFFVGYVRSPDLGASSARLASLAAFSPTSWLLGILPFTGVTIWSRFLYAVGFVAATVVFPGIAFWLFKKKFRRIWAVSVEVKRGSRPRRPGQERKAAEKKSGSPGEMRAVILKEARVLRREPYIWVGLVIPLALFPIFIFSGAQEPQTQGVYIILVSLLAATSYSLSSIGREGRTFPLLRSLPVRMSVVLWGKFLLSCAASLFVAFAFVMTLYLLRRSSLSHTWHNALVAVAASVYLSAFGTALAALFPKFDFTNPMRAASVPGILTLYLISFLFMLTFVVLVPAGWYFNPFALIPWAVVALIMLRSGQNRLERLDV